MKKTCLECGAEFEGRCDKKFCCDMCRNSYHNRIYREEKNLLSRVNCRMATNRRILENLYDAGMRTVPKNLLEEEKFDFRHFTSFNKSPLGKITYRCYEYTYFYDRHRNIIILKD